MRESTKSSSPTSIRNDGYTYTDVVDAGAEGWPVLEFYSRRYLHSDRPTWARRIAESQIWIDGRCAGGAETLRTRQRLEYRRPSWVEPAAPRHFRELYDDGDLLAVAKPSGLPVLPGGEFLHNTLLHAVRERHAETPAPLHRLGRGTSGIVLFARSGYARQRLSEAFRDGGLHKVYRALVIGHPTKDAFDVETPIGRMPYSRLGQLHAAVDPEQTPASEGAKASLSHVRVIERRTGDESNPGASSLVDVDIRTGRPHQIRIHMAAAGHPLVGEPLYDIGGVPLPSGPGRPALPGDMGYHLHARKLLLWGPQTGKRIGLFSQPPQILMTTEEKTKE